MNATVPDTLPENLPDTAARLRETYLALILVGFTEKQALTVIGHMLEPETAS
jgi:hypothetical protein